MSINNGSKQLTYDQIQRLKIGIEALAKAGNPFAISIAKALDGKTPAQMRNTLSGSYARMFEVMTMMGMAMDSKINPKQVMERLAQAEAKRGD